MHREIGTSQRLKGARLIRLGAVVGPHRRDEPAPPMALRVDVGIWLEFERDDGERERWETGTVYQDITVSRSDGRSLEEQLDGFVRDATRDDLIADMQLDGYQPDHAADDLVITWHLADDVSARFDGRRRAPDR